MNTHSQFRLLCQLAIATVIIFTADQFAQAQTSGGEFNPIQPRQHQSELEQTPESSLPDGFNALPFRNKNATPRDRRLSPLRTVTQPNNSAAVNQPAITQSAPSPDSRLLRSPQPTAPKSQPNALMAQTVSFGKPVVPVPPQGNSRPSPQDEAGANFKQDMPKYVDLNCSVKFIDDIRLPAKETGVIKTLEVKEGDFVPAGKTVGQIDDELYQQMLVQAEMRYKMAVDTAQDETAKKAAEKKFGVASIEATKARKLWRSGSRSESEKLMAEYSEQLAALEITKADLEMKKARGEAELELAKMKEVKTRIQRHVIQSDFDSYVIEIFKKPQEFVNIGEEVLRIARMDHLWVQGILDIRDLNPHEAINRTVTVTVPLARGETTTFEGKIVNVALERQSSQHYMVKAEIKNRPIGGHWVLQPFSEVQMRIHLDRPASEIGASEVDNVNR